MPRQTNKCFGIRAEKGRSTWTHLGGHIPSGMALEMQCIVVLTNQFTVDPAEGIASALAGSVLSRYVCSSIRSVPVLGLWYLHELKKWMRFRREDSPILFLPRMHWHFNLRSRF
jgi:hypothetical protein